MQVWKIKEFWNYSESSLAVAYAVVIDAASVMRAAPSGAFAASASSSASFPSETEEWTDVGLVLSPYAPFQSRAVAPSWFLLF